MAPCSGSMRNAYGSLTVNTHRNIWISPTTKMSAPKRFQKWECLAVRWKCQDHPLEKRPLGNELRMISLILTALCGGTDVSCTLEMHPFLLMLKRIIRNRKPFPKACAIKDHSQYAPPTTTKMSARREYATKVRIPGIFFWNSQDDPLEKHPLGY